MLDQKKEILAGKWDILVVFDACRYDIFAEEYQRYFQGKLHKARSPAHKTDEWMASVFRGKKHDIDIVTGNPVIYASGNNFVKLFNSFRWLDTIYPREITQELIKRTKTKLKRKNIIWYMQPHAPHLGKYRVEIPGDHKAHTQPEKHDYTNKMWSNARNGKIKIKDLRESYRSNLCRGLESFSLALPQLKNYRVFITSDHGELLGEDGYFEHTHQPSNHRILREVPWLELEG